jgi:hypothetical protein
MLAENGHWAEVENWKVALADIATRYQRDCNIKIFDFSGFNSLTAERIDRMTPEMGLANYWEASHFRDNVGKLVLRRLFAPDPSLPTDFGRELNNDTVAAINSLSNRERANFLLSHSNEILLANAWLKVDTSR